MVTECLKTLHAADVDCGILENVGGFGTTTHSQDRPPLQILLQKLEDVRYSTAVLWLCHSTFAPCMRKRSATQKATPLHERLIVAGRPCKHPVFVVRTQAFRLSLATPSLLCVVCQEFLEQMINPLRVFVVFAKRRLSSLSLSASSMWRTTSDPK